MAGIDVVKQKYEMLREAMDERMSRLWAASEALTFGWGGISSVAKATGLSHATIRAGVREFEELGLIPTTPLEPQRPEPSPRRIQWRDRIRLPGGGRKLTEVRDPAIVPTLEKLLANEIGGDPISDRKWVRCSLRQLCKWLKDEGHPASSTVVSRLLKKMGYSLKANERKQGQSRANCPERDEQFRYIASQRETSTAAGWPIISVDTKKKELIGNFRNKGKRWCKKADEVDEHDFPSAAECRAVPFGIYELIRNRGHVYVGVSNDTPEFAVVSIANWWEEEGRAAYPGTDRLLILADGGGSNGCRARAWKCKLQALISNRFGLTLTVCHYPTGCSKWNPVEHRLFSQISRNWAGKPRRSLETMLGYIRGTRTETGLAVTAYLDEGFYKKSVPYTPKDVDRLSLKSHDVCPQWNYTISPQSSAPGSSPTEGEYCHKQQPLIESPMKDYMAA
jgi:Rhodopirellula transposase DDE domain